MKVCEFLCPSLGIVSGCVLSVATHCWHTLGCLMSTVQTHWSAVTALQRVTEHFCFHFYFHSSLSQWASVCVCVSEACSESQGWLSVGGGFAGGHRRCSVQSSCLTAPHHARCFCLWRGLILQRSFLLQPFSNTALLFLSPWGR